MQKSMIYIWKEARFVSNQSHLEPYNHLSILANLLYREKQKQQQQQYDQAFGSFRKQKITWNCNDQKIFCLIDYSAINHDYWIYSS